MNLAHAVEPRAHGGQHPLLPAPGPPAARRRSPPGAIDSFASTVIQVVLLVLLLLFSEATLSLDLSAPAGGSRVCSGSWSGCCRRGRARRVLSAASAAAIVERVRTWWPEVRASLAALRALGQARAAALGNIATELLFASALGLFARGSATHPLADLLVINMSVSLFASFIPVPGGIGVVEFGLTVGLTSAGHVGGAALAAVLLYRLSTFYLPPIWGFFALRWLEKNKYL